MFEAFDFTASISEASIAQFESVCDDDPRISREDLAMLCEIGVLALAAERGEAARPIFELLDAEQPQNAAGPIGLAMIDVASGREKDGFARLRNAIASRESCVAEAKAVLCVLLTTLGRAPEARVLRRELLRGPDCGARRLVAAYGAI